MGVNICEGSDLHEVMTCELCDTDLALVTIADRLECAEAIK